MFQKGLFLGFGLISNLGVQNTFLARQAFTKNSAWFCASVCFLCDIFLISSAMYSSYFVLTVMPKLKLIFLIFAVIFLSYQGVSALKLVWAKESLVDIRGKVAQQSLTKLLFICLGFSLLNPNALLDTYLILGGVSTNLHGWQKVDFSLGAIVASAIWFYGLVYLVKKFHEKISWSWFNGISATIMFITALLCTHEIFITIT